MTLNIALSFSFLVWWYECKCIHVLLLMEMSSRLFPPKSAHCFLWISHLNTSPFVCWYFHFKLVLMMEGFPRAGGLFDILLLLSPNPLKLSCGAAVEAHSYVTLKWPILRSDCSDSLELRVQQLAALWVEPKIWRTSINQQSCSLQILSFLSYKKTNTI